jgi:hypothetical protein
MDDLDFLDGSEEPNAETQPVETPVAEAPAEAPAEPTPEPEGETAEQKATRERDEKGRFKAKEQEQPVMVPLQALHETRDEVKALKQQLAALQPQQQPQAPQVPDIFENPEGYTQYLQSQIAQTTLNDRLNLSEEMVRQSTGDETVNAAQEWGRQMLAANPMFAQTFYAQRNPYGFLVGEYKRHQTLSQLGNADPKEIEAFIAWKNTQQQPGATPNPEPSPAPPRSIASATSAGGMRTIAMGPTAAFDELFQGK